VAWPKSSRQGAAQNMSKSPNAAIPSNRVVLTFRSLAIAVPIHRVNLFFIFLPFREI
jgi:hypothetical protein